MFNFIHSLPWYAIFALIAVAIPILFVLFIWIMLGVLAFIVSRLKKEFSVKMNK